MVRVCAAPSVREHRMAMLLAGLCGGFALFSSAGLFDGTKVGSRRLF